MPQRTSQAPSVVISWSIPAVICFWSVIILTGFKKLTAIPILSKSFMIIIDFALIGIEDGDRIYFRSASFYNGYVLITAIQFSPHRLSSVILSQGIRAGNDLQALSDSLLVQVFVPLVHLAIACQTVDHRVAGLQSLQRVLIGSLADPLKAALNKYLAGQIACDLIVDIVFMQDTRDKRYPLFAASGTGRCLYRRRR